MYKYAQMFNGKVHWIMEDEMTLDELYTNKFCKDHITFVDITNISSIPEVGWSFDGITFTPPAIAVPTVEELLAVIRSKRNVLLAECDWTQIADVPLAIEQKLAWSVYRQSLRDFPETCDPTNPVWPIKPQTA